jgi:hypothetical protein
MQIDGILGALAAAYQCAHKIGNLPPHYVLADELTAEPNQEQRSLDQASKSWRICPVSGWKSR